jgi:hypothetical protein
VTFEKYRNDDTIEISFEEIIGKIQSDLSIGADVSGSTELESNKGIAIKGFELGSQGFLTSKEVGDLWMRENSNMFDVLRPYMNGTDLVKGHCDRYVVDFFGLSEAEALKYGIAYQHVHDLVKAERLVNREERTANKWWVFRRSGESIRNVLAGLTRFIGTTRTAKHRVFQFLPINLIAESSIVIIASPDAYYLGLLSSRIHLIWSLAAGGFLGVGNDPTYNHLYCFNKFPFPNASQEQKQQIRDLAEGLESHRRNQQALHPTLTITDMYNILEKLRSGEALNSKEKELYEQGLVSILLQLHNELDAAVAAAYNWPENLTADKILEKIVELNKERAAEEALGMIRWIRPEYQNRQGVQQTVLNVPTAEVSLANTSTYLSEWPMSLAEQAHAVNRVIQQSLLPVSATYINTRFKKAKKKQIELREQQIKDLLETISTLGLVRKTSDGSFVR